MRRNPRAPFSLFFERIKTGKIKKDTIPESGEYRQSFLLCLLDKEERKKLEQKDEEFMKTFKNHLHPRNNEQVDVPEAEWKASNSNLKFARSFCLRETYFIDA